MLDVLEAAARRLGEGAQQDEDWCRNRVWYEVLKPQLVRTVGWVRELIAPSRECELRSCTIEELLEERAKGRKDDPFLRTEEAYDIAYDHLYSVLPDCRHEGPCRE